MGCTGCHGDCSSCGTYGEVINTEDLPEQKITKKTGQDVRLKIKELDSRDVFRAVERLLKRFKPLSQIRIKRGEVLFQAPVGFNLNQVKSALREKGFHLS